MRKSDAVEHYGSQAAIGRELGIGKAAVSKWPKIVPRGWAAELHILSGYKLPFDQRVYRGKRRRPKARS